MAKRIYKVTIKSHLPSDDPINDEYTTHLVNAKSASQAEKHVTKKIVTASVATVEEGMALAKDGVEVEEVGE